jgi:hypothetical protein
MRANYDRERRRKKEQKREFEQFKAVKERHSADKAEYVELAPMWAMT